MGTIANLITYVGAATGDFHKGMGAVLSKGQEVAVGFAKFGAIAGAAVAGVGIAAGKMAMDFQDAMANVDTLLGPDSTAQLAELSKSVKRTAVLTGQNLGDMANGMYETVSAFGVGADNAAQFEIAAKAAKGGVTQTVEAVKLLSAWTKGYGDVSAAAVQKAADLAFMTTNLGQTTFPELAASMGKAIPLAVTLSVSQEELAGSFATLTGVTGNTAEVATQMQAVFRALINPTTEMAAKLSKLGFSSGKSAIETMGLQGTLDLLAQSTGGNTAQLAKMLGSTEALNAVLSLTGAQSADFTAKTQAMTQAAGAADAAFQKKTATVKGMVDRLKEMGTVAMVELGEKFLPAFMAVGEWIMSNMPAIQNALDVAFQAIGAVVTWLGGVFTWFRDNILVPFVSTWLGDTEAMQTPIGQFALAVKASWDAIAGFIAGFRTNIWEPFVRGWATGAAGMGNIWQFTGARIGSIVQSLWGIIKGVWELLVMYWNAWGDDIMKVVKIAWEFVLNIIDGVLKIVKGIIDFFIALFKGDWEGLWQAIKTIWEGLWQIIVSVVTTAWELLKVAIQNMVDATVAIWNWLVKAVTDLWNWMWQGIVDVVTGAWDWLKGAFASLWDSIAGWFTGLWEAAKDWGSNVMRGFWDGITGWFGRISESVANFVSEMTAKVQSVLGIHSPSKVFAEIGANIGRGLAVGIEGTGDLVNRALAEITPGPVTASMRAINPAGGQSASAGAAGPRTATIPIILDGRTIAEYTVDLLTGTVRQPARAMGY